MLGQILVWVVVTLPLAGFHLLVRRNRDAPSPDGLEVGEDLLKGMAATADIDGLTPGGNGYAYLTDRRLVWTPRMDSWHVQNARPGLPYTQPVVIDFRDIRKASTPFHLGGSVLRVESKDVRLALQVEARSFGFWLRHILANARNLIPDEQEVLPSRRRYSRLEFLQVTRPHRVATAVAVAFVGLYVLSKWLRLGFDELSSAQVIAILLSGGLLAIGYIMWSNREQT